MTRFGIIGCGYVGSGVALQARSRGYLVTGTTTNPNRLSELCKVVDHPRLCRAGDPRADYDFLDDLDGLLIAMAPSSMSEQSNYQSVFGEAVPCLLHAIQQRNSSRPLHVTYLSSAGVYGDKAGQVTGEQSPPDRTDPTNALLAQAEDAVLELDDSNLRSCILRLGGIYGPGQDIPGYIKSASGQQVAKNGNHFNAWVHLKDIIRGILFAYENQLSGIYNLVDDLQLTRRQLSNELCDSEGLAPVIWENHNRDGSRIFNARVSNQRLKNLGFKLMVPSMLSPVPA